MISPKIKFRGQHQREAVSVPVKANPVMKRPVPERLKSVSLCPVKPEGKEKWRRELCEGRENGLVCYACYVCWSAPAVFCRGKKRRVRRPGRKQPVRTRTRPRISPIRISQVQVTKKPGRRK